VNGGSGSEEVEQVNTTFTLLTHIYAFFSSDYVQWLRIFYLDGDKRKVKEWER